MPFLLFSRNSTTDNVGASMLCVNPLLTTWIYTQTKFRWKRKIRKFFLNRKLRFRFLFKSINNVVNKEKKFFKNKFRVFKKALAGFNYDSATSSMFLWGRCFKSNFLLWIIRVFFIRLFPFPPYIPSNLFLWVFFR